MTERKKQRATTIHKAANWLNLGSLSGALKSKRFWAILIATVGSVTAGAAAFVTNFETIASHATAYYKTREYLLLLKHPYPSLLDEHSVADWNVGTLELAVYQIEGYLGQLKPDTSWKRQCLTTKEIFPHNFSNQW